MRLEFKPLRECSPVDLVALEEASFSSDRISERSFRRLLRGRTAEGQAVFEGGRLVGYSLLLFRANSRKARIYSLAVSNLLRGRGIGRQLLLGAEELVRQRGCTTLQLEVSVDNSGAKGLYESLGYRIVGRRANYYQDGADALVYSKSLD